MPPTNWKMQSPGVQATLAEGDSGLLKRRYPKPEKVKILYAAVTGYFKSSKPAISSVLLAVAKVISAS